MDRNSVVSRNEKEFILKALTDGGLRVDGRKPYEFRPIEIKFALDDSCATVTLGNTMVMAVVTAEVKEPYPDRPSEGNIQFQVEFSPMATQEFEVGRPGEAAVEVARIIERSLRDSRALDTEALVILSGRKVWHVRCTIHVLDHDGNLTDACALAALSALTVFRRPDVTIGGATGTEVTVHPRDEREPVPLTIHHVPLAVTVALFEDGTSVALDPTFKEEATMTGQITCVLNKQQELCSIQKRGGVGVASEMVEHCINVAGQKVIELTEQLEAALAAHSTLRVQARIRKHASVPVGVPATDGPPTTARGGWRAAAIEMRKLEAAAAVVASTVGEDSSSDDEEMAEVEERGEQETEVSAATGDLGNPVDDENAAAMLPTGALLMPAVVKAAGLVGNTRVEEGKRARHGAKKSRKVALRKRVEDEYMDDDYADIAAVIAGAAARGDPAEGLTGAIKPKERRRK